MLGWLLACTDAPHRRAPPAVEPPEETAHTADTGSGAPGCTFRRPPTGGLRPGGDLRRVTFADSPARCNDGTPPVAWVRAGDPDRFVVQLRGGGFCGDPEGCRDRWCGRGGYDAGNMSSAWAPAGVSARGLLAPEPGSPFEGWTVVEVHYCSSDTWLGARPVAELGGWTIGFEGAGIVDHVMGALAAGVASDDGAEVLAPLADAEVLVLSGSSAGGAGAAIHLDRVGDRFPDLAVVGLVDSVLTLRAADVGAAEVPLDGDPVAFWGLDPEALGCGDDCLDLQAIALEHRRRPVAWRHDLVDPVVGDRYIPPLTPEEFATASEIGLRRLAAAPGVGVLGPHCGDHMAVPGPAFERESVVDAIAGGPPLTLEGVLLSVLAGAPVSAIDAPSGGGSVCRP